MHRLLTAHSRLFVPSCWWKCSSVVSLDSMPQVLFPLIQWVSCFLHVDLLQSLIASLPWDMGACVPCLSVCQLSCGNGPHMLILRCVSNSQGLMLISALFIFYEIRVLYVVNISPKSRNIDIVNYFSQNGKYSAIFSPKSIGITVQCNVIMYIIRARPCNVTPSSVILFLGTLSDIYVKCHGLHCYVNSVWMQIVCQ